MKRIFSIFLALLFTPSFSFCQTSPDCSAVTIISATNNGVNTISTYVEADGIRNGNDYFGATIYYPQNTMSTLGSIIIIPGYANLESSIQNWGPFLASHGIVCMTIGTNNIFNLVNARKEALQDALISLKAENTRLNSPLFNRLDTNRIALGGWSMGGGGAQLAAVEDSTIKAIIALCPWIDPAQITINSLNHDTPILLFSGQIDAIAPPNTYANIHYNYTPNTTDKLIYEISLGGHTVANSPSGGQGEVGRMALSWLKKYLIEDSCHCPLLLDTPATASVYQTNITCPVYGCTDSLACNYDSLANVDNGSCLYPSLAPYHEDFGSGTLPVGIVCNWSQDALIGDGWRFDGLPGYAAAYNGRDTGTYAWVDFSNTDSLVVLEVEIIDISNLITPGLFFDFYSYVDTFGVNFPLNILNVETWNGITWVLQGSFQTNVPGWNTQLIYLTNTPYINNLIKIRFRAESSVGADYFNDLLIDDVKIQEIVIGCSDSLACNYDVLVNIDDGSCIFPDGCTDSLACNYSPIALCNDSSCCYDSPSIAITANACDSYVWSGNTYTSSGTYVNTNTNLCGCDSVVILDLSISYTDSVSVIDTGYNFFNWNAQVLTSSGIYTEILTNAAGCDSIVTLDLIIITITDLIDISNENREIHKIINVLGKEILFKRNELLFYIYDDGTVEKKIAIE